MCAVASQITSLTIVYSTVCSGADQRKHQSSASLAFVWGIHRWPVNSPHKWPVTRTMFPFDYVIILREIYLKMCSAKCRPFCLGPNMFTHWGRGKMAAISQTIFRYAFSWMKTCELRLRFHWNLFLRFKLTIFQHWFWQWLCYDQATIHYLNQWLLVYWRIYTSIVLNELDHCTLEHNDCLSLCGL